VETLEQVILSNAVVATVLALLASAIGLVCRRPALVHSLWLLVLIKLITPPIWQVEIFRLPSVSQKEPQDLVFPVRELPKLEVSDLHESQPAEVAEPEKIDNLVLHREEAARPEEMSAMELPPAASLWSWPSWKPLLWSVWLSGTLAWLLMSTIRVVRFQLLLRWAEPAPDELQERVQVLAECLGLKNIPSVWLVPGVVSPMIWPVGIRPRLLVPHGLLDRLTHEQRDTLLVHELAHLRRHDHWVRGLELIVTGLYWWHPVVWWGRQAMREAEEQCCDAWVMWALPAARRAYASALVEALDFLAGARPVLLPPAACGLGQFQTLKRRLTMILTGTTPHALSRLGFLAVLGLGFFLPVVPTWGQSDDDEKRIEKKEIIKKDFIKKLQDEALKQVDVDAIKKEVRDALGKELKIELGDLGDLKVDLNLDLEGLVQDLEDLGDTKDAGRKELDRARQQLKRAMAQVERAKVQFAKAQKVLDEAQKRLAQLEDSAKTNPDMLKEKTNKAERLLELKEKMKAEKDKAEKPKRDLYDKEIDKARRDFQQKGARSKDDELERRFDKMMREMQELGRELKRRRAESSSDKPQEF
jgi:beta-lactamase regulating signal transducer with metallopeptidase domain